MPGEVRPGIGLVNKPPGITSFSVVQAITTPLKLCHGGTLDPFAEGLLLLLADPATAWAEYLHTLPKTYEAELAWGFETDTLDGGGKIIAENRNVRLSPQLCQAALERFLGWTEQQAPAFSAKRIHGERAYEKAFRGEAVELPHYPVYLHRAAWLSHDFPRTSRMVITCRGGFYVRSLVRDIGRLLGGFATTTALKRTQIGPFALVGAPRWYAGASALPWCPRRVLTDAEVGSLKAGKPVGVGAWEPAGYVPEAGYPAVDPPVLGVHLGKCAFLLEQREGMLWARQSVRKLGAVG